MTLRNHDHGPIIEPLMLRPGWVGIRLTFDMPDCYIPGHVHAFDHVMRVESGSLLLDSEGQEKVLIDGAEELIVAGKRHGLRALKSGTVALCEHEVRHENGELYPDAFTTDGIPVEWVTRLTV